MHAVEMSHKSCCGAFLGFKVFSTNSASCQVVVFLCAVLPYKWPWVNCNGKSGKLCFKNKGSSNNVMLPIEMVSQRCCWVVISQILATNRACWYFLSLSNEIVPDKRWPTGLNCKENREGFAILDTLVRGGGGEVHTIYDKCCDKITRKHCALSSNVSSFLMCFCVSSRYLFRKCCSSTFPWLSL